MENEGNGKRPPKANARQLALVVPPVETAHVNEYGHDVQRPEHNSKAPLDPTARRQAVLAEHASTLNAEIGRLRREVQDSKLVVRNLRAQLAEALDETAAAKAAMSRASIEAQERGERLSVLATSVAELESELEVLRPQVVSHLERRMMDERFRDLEAERDRLVQIASNFPKELKSVLESREALAEEIGHIRWALEQATAGQSAQADRADQLASRADALSEEIVHLRWALEQETSAGKAAVARETALAEEMIHLRWALAQATAGLEAERTAHVIAAERDERQRDALARLEGQRTRLQAHVNALLASRSWRVTAPLRWLKARWHRLRGRG